MWVWIKEKVLFILLVISLLGNAGLIALLMKGGIHITNTTTSTSTANSYSNASSSAIGININGGNYWGDKKVSYKSKMFSSIEEAMVFINSLDEGNLYNKSILFVGANVCVIYREVSTQAQTGSVTKKTVDGVEVQN